MKKKFLGIICIIYALIIVFVKRYAIIGNFLAPQMHIYINVTLYALLIIGVIVCYSSHISFKFKFSDLILLLPVAMLIFAGDGRLTTTFASNRSSNLNNKKTTIKKEIEKENDTSTKSIDIKSIDFTKIDFVIEDDSYFDTANMLTYSTNPDKYVGKTIRVKGFTITNESYLPKGYFALGKYGVSCCAADAGFLGFIAKLDDNKVKDNEWYEIEGVFEKTKDLAGFDILTIKIHSIKTISSTNEEVYVYPCYSYYDGTCSQLEKYNLQD